jgi:anionic cell wall polymer biosynthesis LytR-Cps2A-Psr (LCP) family protein
MVTNPVIDDFYHSDLSSSGDPYACYRMAVLPGATQLDGGHALQYVRSRHGDLRGDFARSARQQQLAIDVVFTDWFTILPPVRAPLHSWRGAYWL